MKKLTSRSYAGKTDLDAIASLLNACNSAVDFDEWPSVPELLMQFDDPSVDNTRDIRLWETDTGELIAVAGLMMPSEDFNRILWFQTQPSSNYCAIETQVVNWGEERMREFAKERDVSTIKILAPTHSNNRDRITFLESCGFQVERYFLSLERSLLEPIAKPQLPEGFTLQPITSQIDPQAWVEMFNETFSDHWNHFQMTVDGYQHKFNDPDYLPHLSAIAIAPDGTFAAFCDCSSLGGDGQQKTQKAWITALGTRQGFRKRGLGRAILLAVMQNLKAEGMDSVMLYVDADNLTGATRLYDAVGFHQVNTQIAYIKQL